MKTLLAYAFVQILGLAVLQNDPKGGVHILFPNVDPESEIHHVESHTTIIAFKTKDEVSVKGWVIKPLRPVDGYSYVTLSGDQVRLEVSSKNKRAAIPSGLPHLTTTCPAMQKLKAGYRKPYSWASAVLSLPEGTLTACQASAPNVVGRIDTRAVLMNKGNFRVTTGEEKSITFRNDALVAFANVPIAWVEGRAEGNRTAPHSQAYFAMAEESAPCVLERAKNVSVCDATAIRQAFNGILPPELPPDATAHLTYECSNTQWP